VSPAGERPAPLRPLPGHDRRAPAEGAAFSLAAPGDERRARILAATADLIGEQGYHATTLDQIVRRAHVGWPVFYKRFADKEAAFLALIEQAYATVLRRVAAAAAERRDEPWPAAVAAALGSVLAAVAAEPLAARACLVEALTAGPASVQRYEAALGSFGTLLRPGRAFSPHAAELADSLEDTLASALAWIAYQRIMAGEAELLPGLLAEALELVLLPYLGEEETAAAVARWGGSHVGKHSPPAGTAA
jgi:AcrR family transcriptional regulator